MLLGVIEYRVLLQHGDSLRLTFLELPAFTQGLEKMGLPDEWLRSLQIDLVLGRGRIDRPPGLGGFKKIRTSNPSRGKGARGGLRVYFLEIEEISTAVLALISDKDVENNIDHATQKTLGRLAEELKKELHNERKKPTRRGR